MGIMQGQGNEYCDIISSGATDMLPYKIRKPVYSGASKYLLPNKPTATNRTDGGTAAVDANQLEQLARDDPRLIGGNLQKAILLDLIDLRERFLEREKNFSTNNIVDTVAASLSSHTHIHDMPSLGTSFGRFKAIFRERRFGAIHNRTAPRNIDRGEFFQLLYSCCFYLLEESVDNEVDVDVQKNKFNLRKATFAVYALYTLHQTNPLPISPPTRQSTPRTKYGNFQEDALKEAWSALPISREEQNLYRKCYKSPVRIDRRNYLLLLQLSDVCKAIVDQCFMGTTESPDNAQKCHCSIAQDATYIIDKMVFAENFFSYCEYHGPCGLEGLAGNPHFYKEHFVKQKKKPKKKNKSKNNGTSASLHASLQLTQDKLDEMKNDDHLTAILNLSALSNAIDKHKSNLQNVTTQLQKSKQPGGDLQPKQRDLVETTLNGVINSQQAYFGITAELELNGEHVPEASRAGKNNITVSVSGAKESDRNDVLPLVFPKSFSSELRGNICEALADFGNEVALIRSTVVEEIRARNTTKATAVIDTNNSIVLGAEGEKDGQSLSDILAFFDVQQEPSDALVVHGERDIKDDMSMATGAGKNALEALLKMAEDNLDSVQLDDHSVSSDDSKGEGDTMDDNSVATGSGMKALQNLLSQSTGGLTKQPTKRPRPASGQNRQTTKREQEDEISVATGAGKNALSSLLNMAENNFGSVESEDSSVSSHDLKGECDAAMDDSSVATGLGVNAKSPKQPSKRKKSPTKPAQSKSVSSASSQKRQKTKRDTKQALQSDKDEVSVDASAAGLSGRDDVSVASTTAAGKDALAALLSQVESVEQV